MAGLLVPDSNRVGKYYNIISGNFDPNEIIASVKNFNHISSLLLASEQGTKTQQVIDALSSAASPLAVRRASESEVDLVKASVTLPPWLLSDKNFEAIEAGHYFDLRPITAEFVPTLNCFFHCKQCAYSEPKKQLGVWLGDGKTSLAHAHEHHMSVTQVRGLIDKLAQGGVENILFTGGGEPLANSASTLAGLKYAREIGLNVGLYTNGVGLTQERIGAILDSNPVFVRISIYGGDGDAFNRYTGMDSDGYQLVLRNIKAIAQAKAQRGSETRLGLSYLVHPETIGSLSRLPESLLPQLTADEKKAINFIRFTPAVEYYKDEQNPEDQIREAFNYIAKELVGAFERDGIDVRIYNHRLKDMYGDKQYKVCRASGWYGEVGPNGEMYLCCERLMAPDFKIGDLTASSLHEVYASDQRKGVLSRVNQASCANCPSVCKPHELNKIFAEIETMREAGLMQELRKWREDVLECGRANWRPGRLNGFES